MTDEIAETEQPKTLTFYPFAYALLDDELCNYCWYCLGEAEKLKKCTGCGVAYFCGKECQALGWKDHRVECKSLKEVKGKGNSIPNVEVRLLGRIVIRYVTIELGKADAIPFFYRDRTSKRSIMEIWSHAEDMRNDTRAWQKFELIYSRLVEFYGETSLCNKETVFQLHCRNYINRHAISNRAYLKEIGKGLYLDLCAYDHSCAPNTIYSCNGFIATLRPLNNSVNIMDRSTTFYTYIDLFASKQQRKQMLKDTWYFDCQCTRCLDNQEHILTSIKCPSCGETLSIFGEQPYKDAATQVIICPKCLTTCSKESVFEAVNAMRFIDGMLEKDELGEMNTETAKIFLENLLERFAPILSQTNIYYCRLIQAIIPRINPEDHEKLLQYHLSALDCMKISYPHNHPALAFHLMNIGVFCLRLKRNEEARNYLTQSQNMLDFALGKDHPMSSANRVQLEEAQCV